MTEKDKCFIVTPIGNDMSEERRNTDGINESIIRPLLKEKGMDVVVAHELSESGSINNQVIKYLNDSKLVIANLTGLNPNVMYELGVRYTLQKHTILICEKNTKLPFDITTERTIFYTNDIPGGIELKQKLSSMLDNINYEEIPENPISRSLKLNEIFENAKEDGGDIANLASVIEKLVRKIDLIDTNNYNSTIGYKYNGGTFADHSATIVFKHKIPNLLSYRDDFSSALGDMAMITGFNESFEEGVDYSTLILNYYCYRNRLKVEEIITEKCYELFDENYEINHMEFSVYRTDESRKAN